MTTETKKRTVKLNTYAVVIRNRFGIRQIEKDLASDAHAKKWAAGIREAYTQPNLVEQRVTLHRINR